MNITVHVVNLFSCNFCCFFFIRLHLLLTVSLFIAVSLSVTVEGFNKNQHGAQDFFFSCKLRIFLPKIFNIFFYLQRGLLQNEKVSDEHSSVTPCQHCPHQLPQSIKKQKELQIFAEPKMQVCGFEPSSQQTSFQDVQSIWSLRFHLLLHTVCGVFIAAALWT